MDRWARAAAEESADRQSRNRQALQWWTPRRTAVVFGSLTVVLLLVTLGLYAHDADLRRPNLPLTTGTVLEQLHRAKGPSKLDVDYSVGRVRFERTVAYSGRLPAVGAPIRLAYVPGHPTRIRPVGGHWDPAYQMLFVAVLVVPMVGVLGGILNSRRRRKLESAAARPTTAGASSQTSPG